MGIGAGATLLMMVEGWQVEILDVARSLERDPRIAHKRTVRRWCFILLVFLNFFSFIFCLFIYLFFRGDPALFDLDQYFVLNHTPPKVKEAKGAFAHFCGDPTVKGRSHLEKADMWGE